MSFKKNFMKSQNYYDVDRLALKMLLNNSRLAQSVERWMRGFLFNKNLCLYYWLEKRIGKKLDFCVAIALEKGLLIFGREEIPYFDKNEMLTEQGGSVFKSIYSEKKMHKKTYQFQGEAYKAIQNNLWSLLGRWEHGAEILAAIAHEQRASGRHELAEAYKKQAIESKKHAESLRKILMGQT